MTKIDTLKHIFFIGIGGAGMSALARYFLQKNIKVSGYDKTETEVSKALCKEGAKVFYEDDINLYPHDIDLVVFTPAIPADHKGFIYYNTNNYKMLKRAQVLGLISKDNKCIAIAGSHGKTTVSSMTTHVLRHCGLDCSAFIGGISKNLNSNFVLGKSNYVVIEADEFDRSFLQLYPEITVITSIDDDHLDIYGTLKGVEDAFIQLTSQMKERELCIVHESVQIMNDLHGEKWNYGKNGKNIFQIDDYKANGLSQSFKVKYKNEIIANIELNISGFHNVENAMAAFIVAYSLGLEIPLIEAAFKTFKGIKRRFDIVLKNEEITYIDDYAHHPEELRSFIKSLRTVFQNKKLTVAFQPHLFSRTRDHAKGIAETLSLADEVLLLDIYPAREKPIEGVSSQLILNNIKNIPAKILSKKELLEYAETLDCDVFATIGAGDIDLLINPLHKIFAAR